MNSLRLSDLIFFLKFSIYHRDGTQVPILDPWRLWAEDYCFLDIWSRLYKYIFVLISLQIQSLLLDALLLFLKNFLVQRK